MARWHTRAAVQGGSSSGLHGLTDHAKAAITSQETMLTRANERSGEPSGVYIDLTGDGM